VGVKSVIKPSLEFSDDGFVNINSFSDTDFLSFLDDLHSSIGGAPTDSPLAILRIIPAYNIYPFEKKETVLKQVLMDMVRRVLPTIANKEELEKDIATVYNGTGALEPRAFNTIVNKLWNADRQVVLSDYASVREKAEQRLVNDQELGMFRPIVQTFVDKATAKKTTEKYTSYDAAWKDVLLLKSASKNTKTPFPMS